MKEGECLTSFDRSFHKVGASKDGTLRRKQDVFGVYLLLQRVQELLKYLWWSVIVVVLKLSGNGLEAKLTSLRTGVMRYPSKSILDTMQRKHFFFCSTQKK